MSSQEHQSPTPQTLVPFQGLSPDERIMHLEGAFEMLDAAPAVKQVWFLLIWIGCFENSRSSDDRCERWNSEPTEEVRRVTTRATRIASICVKAYGSHKARRKAHLRKHSKESTSRTTNEEEIIGKTGSKLQEQKLKMLDDNIGLLSKDLPQTAKVQRKSSMGLL